MPPPTKTAEEVALLPIGSLHDLLKHTIDGLKILDPAAAERISMGPPPFAIPDLETGGDSPGKPPGVDEEGNRSGGQDEEGGSTRKKV